MLDKRIGLNDSARRHLFELLLRMTGKELAFVFAQLAHDYFLKGDLTATAEMAKKIKLNSSLKDLFFLALARVSIAKGNLDEARSHLKEASDSKEKDHLAAQMKKGAPL